MRASASTSVTPVQVQQQNQRIYRFHQRDAVIHSHNHSLSTSLTSSLMYIYIYYKMRNHVGAYGASDMGRTSREPRCRPSPLGKVSSYFLIRQLEGWPFPTFPLAQEGRGRNRIESCSPSPLSRNFCTHLNISVDPSLFLSGYSGSGRRSNHSTSPWSTRKRRRQRWQRPMHNMENSPLSLYVVLFNLPIETMRLYSFF